MGNLPKQKDYKDLTPFDLVLIQKFPFIEEDFDVINLYAILSKIVEYLNTTINNQLTVQDNETTVYNYVKHYFDNLDVQEEINNKLDEMVQDGTINSIITSYINNTVEWCFNSVNEMVNATNLVNGSFAKTSGYYSNNDGGGAFYKIRTKTNNDTEDNGSIIFLTNNLVAELIPINNKVNVKQFGAKGNGSTDDTNAFKNLVSYIKNKIVNDSYNFNNYNVLYIPNGEYKITQTIEIPTYIKIVTTGFATLVSYVSNGSCIKYYQDTSETSFFTSAYNVGNIIDGSKGLLIRYKDDSRHTGAIGLEFVNQATLGSQIATGTASFTVESVKIAHFDIGILINSKHMYLQRFVNCNLGSNNYGIQFGTSSTTTSQNTGENFTFERCMFGGNLACFNFYISSCDCNIINCSMDFVGLCFKDNSNKGYRKIFVNGGHIEQCDYSPYNTDGGGVVTTPMQNSILSFSNVTFVLYNDLPHFTNLDSKSKLIINDCKIVYMERTTKTEIPQNKMFLIDNPNKAQVCFYNNHNGNGQLAKPLALNSSEINYPFFANLTDGSLTVETQDLGTMDITNVTNIDSLTVGANTGLSGHKIINAHKSDSDGRVQITSKKIPCRPFDEFDVFVLGRNCWNSSICYTVFYDESGNQLSTENTGIYTTTINTSDNMFISPYYAKIKIPAGAFSFKTSYSFRNTDASVSNIIIGGMIINKN